jgi:predicted transposase YbfD/YdcC
VFGARLFLTPSGSLYRKLLPRLDTQAIEDVLARWIQATLQGAEDEPIALDGKTLRGAKTGEQAAPHLLSFCTHESQQTLFQVRVSEKTNEIPVAKAVLPTLPVAGRVLTSDALHTHADFMQLTHDLQGKSLFTVKQNQPTLYADLATYFADPHAVCQQDETWDRRRGRVEHRVIRVSTEMNVYLAAAWPLVAIPSRNLCNGTEQKGPEVKSEQSVAPSHFTPLHKIRDGIPRCPGRPSDTYRHGEGQNLDGGRLSHHRSLPQAGIASALALPGARPLGH